MPPPQATVSHVAPPPELDTTSDEFRMFCFKVRGCCVGREAAGGGGRRRTRRVSAGNRRRGRGPEAPFQGWDALSWARPDPAPRAPAPARCGRRRPAFSWRGQPPPPFQRAATLPPPTHPQPQITPCAVKSTHPWGACAWAHPHENARRRDPRSHRYVAEPCPDYRHGLCVLGSACPFAHGVYERHLHPSRYRTRPCAEGGACARRVCFFAHSPAEARAPTHEWSVGEAEAERAARLGAIAGDPGQGELAAQAAALLAGRPPPLPLRPLVCRTGSGFSAASGDGSASRWSSVASSPRGHCSAPGSPPCGASAATTPGGTASRFGPATRDCDGPRMSMAVRRRLGYAPPPRDERDARRGSRRGSALGSAPPSGAGTPRGGGGCPPLYRGGSRCASGAASPACAGTPRTGDAAAAAAAVAVAAAVALSADPRSLGAGSGDLGEAVSALGVRFSFMGDGDDRGSSGGGRGASSDGEGVPACGRLAAS